MKKLINTIRNIFKIEDLRNRIITTLGLIAIFRLGTYVVLPGIDPAQLEALTAQTSGGGLLGMIDLFAGGAFGRAAIFALGIMPYISASIVVQLLGMAVPYFQKLQKEGESGRRKINQITRYLTILITAVQASGYIVNLQSTVGPAIVVDPGLFWVSSIVILTAGTMFTMWLGEKITDRGIGNGISLLITIGIMANLPASFMLELTSKFAGQGGIPAFVIEIIFLVLVVIAVILLVQGVRKIPVQYAKRIVGNKQYGGVRQYIPMKVNAAGVMPIIFAQAIMFLPATLLGRFAESSTGFLASLSDLTSFWYNLILFLMVILFTYFYTALQTNPTQMADDMKRNGGYIPGVKPGRKTADFIDTIMSRITLPGSIFLGLVTILPAFAMIAGVNTQFALFYGGTSLLIMVAVVLDTLQQIESHLLMRHYDGLMKTGRIKGRTGMVGM